MSGARRTALWLFLLLNCFYALTSTGRVRTMDEVMAIFQAESLALHASTAVPQAVHSGNYFGKFDASGQPRAAAPPGHSAAAVPWYWFGLLLTKLPGVPAAAHDLLLGFAVTLSSATFAAAAATLLFLLFVRLGIALRLALATVLGIALGTPLFAYSGWFYSEPLTILLLVGATLALFGRPGDEAVPENAAAIAGALLGAAVLVRPTHVLAAPAFLAAVLVRERSRGLRPAVICGVILALGVGALMAYHYAIFGSPFELGYPTIAEGKHVDRFEFPARGLFAFLFSPGKSVFLFAPPVLLAIYGLRRLWRRDRGLATAAAALPLVYLLFYSSYAQFEGGYSFGPRYMIPPLILLCCALGPVIAEGGMGMCRIAMLLFAAGAVVQVIGLSTSFLEAMVSGGYYDRAWNYNLSYSPLWEQAKLLLKYASGTEPARIGLGFDRWFLFLAKGGAPLWLVTSLLAAFATGLLVSAWALRRRWALSGDATHTDV